MLAIARGGLGLAMGLGYALDVKNLSAVNVEFYTGVNERLDVPMMLPPTPAAIDLTGMKVLIADDVADTGKTLEVVRDFFADHVAEARTAVIYEKPWTVINARVRLGVVPTLDRLPLVVDPAAGRPPGWARPLGFPHGCVPRLGPDLPPPHRAPARSTCRPSRPTRRPASTARRRTARPHCWPWLRSWRSCRSGSSPTVRRTGGARSCWCCRAWTPPARAGRCARPWG